MEKQMKFVFDTTDYYRFIRLLREITPYQLKVDKANGNEEVLNISERIIYYRLKKELDDYYQQLDKAWFN
ncbi:MAG: hypothetical protein ACQEWU_13135 [Bacillota bacterium]|uniref:Uncharacterized protein n=1 Tax=Virgibacillus salarius TaxID=447199 RepID=A0A941I7N5_9BACI|nr:MULTISPECIES: hypothetical protein [Bacillaceae]NAZ07424.1 hypothetical protein [Agaribacter marinus]MBR7794704.1 hypothetical protein [Virgibacillus salarius]MCC2249558.1 hypothetical protein [Virgibacillus sp. AGTR]MDY7044502.1 hypothetical protein [Virgibacillus sp. M23]QRZ19361.1 hypothetical protein JUJ52_06680 [Virgibacillus sp. AGTR]